MTITRQALDALTAHARHAAPEECCGVLLGVGERIVAAVPGRNLAASPTRFELDPRDHIAARRQARSTHQEVLGFYHSHPGSRATPSETDVAEWSYPEAIALIVSLDGEHPDARAFRLANDGAVEEIRLEVEPSGAA